MSETIHVSPLLDGFALGNPIREHNGIRCHPAIKENTDKKYIVKIISIPASQVQMDALLLAGAYKDPSDAMDYFRSQAEDVLKEAALLKNLSKLEGFLSYEGWQMEPINRHRLGYEVYLVGSYKRSLERYIRHHAVTHLEAINLGLDMCNALSVCRQAGALYVDLKPANIFLSDKKEYRIGDLGFLSMDTLRYASLPEKYQSVYTPPELFDPMASVNMTADTYALGMILYQLYNDGTLPFKEKSPEEGLPSPVQADYELAEIIMKAIHPDPEQRYQDPAEMGKALAAYMQRNSINDVAITPLRTKKAKKKKQPIPEEAQEPVTETVAEEAAEQASEPAAPEVAESTTEIASSAESIPEEDTATENVITDAPAATDEAPVPAELVETAVDAEDETLPGEPEEPAQPEEPKEAELTEEPQEEPPVISEELARILTKADDLIAHEPPEGLQFPEEPEKPDPFAFVLDEDEIDDSDFPYDPLMEEEPEPEIRVKKKRGEKKFADPKYKQRRKRFFRSLVLVVILVLAAAAGIWYYQNLYLHTINALTITGDRSQILVQVDSEIEDDLLQVTCRDNYGKSTTQALTDGQTIFTGLKSNTMYTIEVEIDGFRRLVGKTSDIFTTAATTNIVSFTSVAGAEDGSVVLSFTVDGDEPDHWIVTYSAEGEQAIQDTFTGHSVTITGLSLGKRYTFTLETNDHEALGGVTTLELMASRLILAENLSVTSSNGTDMTVRWDTPGDVIVSSWDVRCYNEVNYDQTLSVADNMVTFAGVDPAWEYTIEVTAEGMTQPARTGITANPINVQSFNVDESDAEKLKINWEYTGNAPDGGWLLLYTIDGSESRVAKCAKNSAEISPRIPGAKYVFTLQSADGVSIFNHVHNFTTSDAEAFNANHLTAEMLTIDLLKTPEEANWYFENISTQQLTNQFQAGDNISIALRSSDSFYLPASKTTVLYVIRDSYGNVLSNTKSEEIIWKNIWTGGDSKNGELNVPSTPANPGSYVLNLYFDGMHVADLPFTIS